MIGIKISADSLEAIEDSVDAVAELPQQVLPDIETAAMARWDALASEKLDTTLFDYRRAMDSQSGDGSVFLFLDPSNEVANMIEGGQAAGPQKLTKNPEFLHTAEDGTRYQNVPISSGARPVGTRSAPSASQLGRRGGRAALAKARRAMGSTHAPAPPQTHPDRQDILSAMRRGIESDDRPIRTMTEDAPWHRPAIRGRHLLNEVEGDIDQIIRPIVDQYLEGVRQEAQKSVVGRIKSLLGRLFHR